MQDQTQVGMGSYAGTFRYLIVIGVCCDYRACSDTDSAEDSDSESDDS